MGVKRPLEEKDFPELSFKQPKQLDNDIKLTFMTDDLSSHRTTQTVDSLGETKSNCCEFHVDGMPENGDMNDPSAAHKELEATVPLPLVTSSSSSDEDTGNEDGSFMYNFPGYVDLSIPWRPPELYHDPYAMLLDSSPRKEVPVGPEHQAEVPQCNPSSRGKDISENAGDNDWEQRMVGTCVIPLPTSDDSIIDGVEMGHGRTDCSCLDFGSMRCVQQHVNEAREKLRETIGEEAFTKLGFYDMGEEVAGNWTVEDEQLFHEVVFSNPTSLGGDFWKHLGDAFPNRSKKELVSYYFNVFMLRRRAVQNRSYLLQIDSDDDEDHSVGHGDRTPVDDEDSNDENDLQHIHGDFYIGEQEDDDSAIEAFDDEVLDAGWVDDYRSEPGNHPSYDDKDNTCGTSGGNDNYNKQDGLDRDDESGPFSGEDTKR